MKRAIGFGGGHAQAGASAGGGGIGGPFLRVIRTGPYMKGGWFQATLNGVGMKVTMKRAIEAHPMTRCRKPRGTSSSRIGGW